MGSLAGQEMSLMAEWRRDRSRMDALFQTPSDDEAQKTPTLGGRFLEKGPGLIDPAFFGISATDAVTIDPQSRTLLEVNYHAGDRMEDIEGTNAGVYSGVMSSDYSSIAQKDVDNSPKHLASGNLQSMIANRISWFYDLRGPSVQMDTACSSSLVAFDSACQGLQNCSTDMVLVAGASMCTSMETTLALIGQGFLSPQGRCLSFHHRANGYSGGEGFSVVLVNCLSDALSDGNTIRAVVRSTGANQDGHTPGITQPSMMEHQFDSQYFIRLIKTYHIEI